jgi:alginate O-acetyltransferase complex protein AlgI
VIFTELRFVLLFALCWITFFAVPRHWRNATLAAFGIAFYAIFAGPVIAIVLLLTLAAYVRAPVALFVIVLIAAKVPRGSWIVPLGLSYLTFELIHVVIERRRGRIQELSLTELLAFAFFAPARIAGPIKRFPQFRTAVAEAELSADDVYAGVLRILLGLAKKFLLADVLALTVAESEYAASMRQAWLVVIAFALQLFLDFSAYSDIAIGFARTLGIRLPENFNWPYLAANIREFWERWHITLSQWVRDYVFTPLGRALFGTRLRPHPGAIATISYLATFAIVGAWHGLELRFVLWGAYHGALLAIFHLWRQHVPSNDSRAMRALGVVTTFFFVTIGWVPFFLPLQKAAHMWALMFGVAR